MVKSIRSYVVETDSGAYLRNRRFIKAAFSRVQKKTAVALRVDTGHHKG